MAPFDKKWSAFPKDNNALTSVFANQTGVYAGVDGYAFRLDYWTGKVVATNPLDGTGYHEVRVASLFDASLLVAGTNGYVVGLDPTTLVTRWTRSLPESGYNITSVLGIDKAIFAGCNGFIYRLNPENGTVDAHNDLKGYGNHEVRLGVTLSYGTIALGINGYAVGLDPKSLAIRWSNDLPRSGYGLTNVVGGSGVVYAGCGGYVFRLDESTGHKLNENLLSGTGSKEVRLAIDGLGTHLFVGTNGYGLGLSPDNLATQYSTSLPSSGYNYLQRLRSFIKPIIEKYFVQTRSGTRRPLDSSSMIDVIIPLGLVSPNRLRFFPCAILGSASLRQSEGEGKR